MREGTMSVPTDQYPNSGATDELSDKDLGMDRGITRLDFLNGIAVTAGRGAPPPPLFSAPPEDPHPAQTPGPFFPAPAAVRVRPRDAGLDSRPHPPGPGCGRTG